MRYGRIGLDNISTETSCVKWRFASVLPVSFGSSPYSSKTGKHSLENWQKKAENGVKRECFPRSWSEDVGTLLVGHGNFHLHASESMSTSAEALSPLAYKSRMLRV